MMPDLPAMEFSALQADVIGHVASVAELLRRTCEVLPGGGGAEQEALSRDLASVEDGTLASVQRLELRLPVVATVNAGKSTLINAISGYRLLPYRTLPMTVLPTEVVLTHQVTQPRLTMPPAMSVMLRQIAAELRERIAHSELAYADAYLEKTLTAIRQGEDVPVGVIHGLEAINSALIKANDLVRLAVMFGVSRDLIEDLRFLPRIECPYPDALSDAAESRHSDLVLIDTPGPNEAGMSAHLLPLIDRSLERAGVIILVLNFMELRSQAQDEIRRQIEPVRDRLGTDRLYVVVNKFDDRRDEDMSPEDTRRFAAHEAGLRVPDDLDRVFLVSARRAFDASSFYRAREVHGDAAWGSPEGHLLGKAVFTDLWPGIRDDLPPEVLDRAPGTVWQNSGFAELLSRALVDLQRQAGQIALGEALQQCAGIIDRLRKYLRVRSTAVREDAASLRAQQRALQSDRDAVASVRSDLGQSRKHRSALGEEIDSAIAWCRDQVRANLDRGIQEDSSRAPGHPAGIWLAPVQSLFLTLGDAVRMPRSRNYGTRKFSTAEEARKFLRELNQAFVVQVAELDNHLQNEVARLVAETEDSLREELRMKAEPIVEIAQRRLEDEFRITLALPVPSFADLAGRFDQPVYELRAQPVRRTATRRIMKRRWFTLWLIKMPVTEVVTLPDAHEYLIDLDLILGGYLAAFNRWLDRLQESLQDRVARDLENSVNDYFGKLDRFLERYLASIQGGIDAGQLGHDNQLKVLEAFEDVLSRADALFDEGRRFTGYLKDFVSAAEEA